MCSPTSSEPHQAGDVSSRAMILSVTISKRVVGAGSTLRYSVFEKSSGPKAAMPVMFGTTTLNW